jgi:transposase InsO family protein
MNEVYRRIKLVYTWPSCKKDVTVFINACEVCTLYLRKPNYKTRALMGHLRSTNRFDIVALDVVGGKESLPSTYASNRVILTIIDLFTKYVVAVPLPDQQADTITRAFLHNWVLRFGPPLRVHTDQGANFLSNVFSNFCTVWRIGKSRTTSYHPQGNGACERVNGTLVRMLVKLVHETSQQHCDNAVAHAVFAYNSCVHESTGYTPFELMYGEPPRLVADIRLGRVPTNNSVHSLALRQRIQLQHAFEQVRVRQQRVDARSKDKYDLGAVPRTFKVGDLVRTLNRSLNVNSKFKEKWSRVLYKVQRVLGINLELLHPHTTKL